MTMQLVLPAGAAARLADILKAHVKAHVRIINGVPVVVHEHFDKRRSAQQDPAQGTLFGAQEEAAEELDKHAEGAPAAGEKKEISDEEHVKAGIKWAEDAGAITPDEADKRRAKLEGEEEPAPQASKDPTLESLKAEAAKLAEEWVEVQRTGRLPASENYDLDDYRALTSGTDPKQIQEAIKSVRARLVKQQAPPSEEAIQRRIDSFKDGMTIIGGDGKPRTLHEVTDWRNKGKAEAGDRVWYIQDEHGKGFNKRADRIADLIERGTLKVPEEMPAPQLGEAQQEAAADLEADTKPAAADDSRPRDPLNGRAYEDEIPMQAAVAAFAGTSHTPEQRGESVRKEYAATLAADYATLSKLATTDEKKATLTEEWPTYHAGYRRKFMAWLNSRANTVSWMIAGRSNFNTRRADKRGAIADRRGEDMAGFREGAMAAIRKKLTPELQPIMAGDDDAVTRLKAKIEQAEQVQERMKAANAAIRKHAKAGPEAQKAALVALGFSEKKAGQLLEKDFAGRVGFPDYATTNNAANIRRLKQRLEQVSANKAADLTQTKGENADIEDDPAGNRVRLTFPGKPDAATREKLKRAGFRWAPSSGAWQAYRNNSSLAFAREFAGAAQAAAAAAPLAAAEHQAAEELAQKTAPSPAATGGATEVKGGFLQYKEGHEPPPVAAASPAGSRPTVQHHRGGALVKFGAKPPQHHIDAMKRDGWWWNKWEKGWSHRDANKTPPATIGEVHDQRGPVEARSPERSMVEAATGEDKW